MVVGVALDCHIADIGLVVIVASAVVAAEFLLRLLENQRMHLDAVIIAANSAIGCLEFAADSLIEASAAFLLNHFSVVQLVLWLCQCLTELLHEHASGSDLSISEEYNLAD